MTQTAFAEWLNETFYTFDNAILGFYHGVAEWGGIVITPIMRAVTFVGEKGIFMFLLAFLLFLFAKTRKCGVCIFGAVCCGALITNFILKDTVCRLRPYEAYEVFREFWNFIGSPVENGYAFPSGHVTAAAAGMTALCLAFGKKFVAAAIPYISLMAISRNYLMAHYPSDIVAAALIGVFSAMIAYVITIGIFRFLKRFEKVKLFHFILHFDLKDAILHIRKN